jgi:hypothetical protein
LKKLRKIVVLEQVLTEVEAVAKDVRRHMLSILEAEESLTMEMEEQERLIRALGVLGVDASSNGTNATAGTVAHLLRHRHKQVLTIMHKMELSYFAQLHVARQRGKQLATHVEGQDSDAAFASAGELDFRELSMFSAAAMGDEDERTGDIGSDKDVGEWDDEWELDMDGEGHAVGNNDGEGSTIGTALLRLSAQYVDELSSFVVESIPGLLRLMQLLVSSSGNEDSGARGESSGVQTAQSQSIHERNRHVQGEQEQGSRYNDPLNAFRPVVSELLVVCARKLRVPFFGGEGGVRVGEGCFADAKELQDWLFMADIEVDSVDEERPDGANRNGDHPKLHNDLGLKLEAEQNLKHLFREVQSGIAALQPQAMPTPSSVTIRDGCITGKRLGAAPALR